MLVSAAERLENFAAQIILQVLRQFRAMSVEFGENQLAFE